MIRILQLFVLVAVIALATVLVITGVQASMPDHFSAAASRERQQHYVEQCIERSLDPNWNYPYQVVLTVWSSCASGTDYELPDDWDSTYGGGIR